MNVIGVDLRHWFHQIPASPWMKKLFGLRDASGFEYQWQSIPMGWSWSPLIAQCAAWSFLAFREGNQEPLLDMNAFKSSRLPTWVDVMWKGEVVGIATVYYDNYLLLVDDDVAFDNIQKRITNNAKELQAVIKKGSEFALTSEEVCAVGFSFLGIFFKGVSGTSIKTRKRQLETIDHMTWWPAKLDEWRSRVDAMPASPTARQVGQMAGMCVFGLMLHPRGFGATDAASTVIDVMRDLGTFVGKEYSRWDEKWNRATVVQKLLQVWANIQRLDRAPYDDTSCDAQSVLEPTYTHIIFSDACTTGLGWNFLNLSGEGQVGAHACLGREVD